MAKVYLLTTGSGMDGDEWDVKGIYMSRASADRAKMEYEKPITRDDGSEYRLEANIEEWTAEE